VLSSKPVNRARTGLMDVMMGLLKGRKLMMLDNGIFAGAGCQPRQP